MRASLSWLRHASPVVAFAAFAAAIFEPAGEEPLRVGSRVREVRDYGVVWSGRYVGRSESGLYVLRFGSIEVLAEREEFVRVD